MGLIGPIGFIGLIRPIRLIGPIGLIRLIRLTGLLLVVLRIAAYRTSLIADSCQLSHHLTSILLGHLEIGYGVEQVDMTYLLTTTHITVQR